MKDEKKYNVPDYVLIGLEQVRQNGRYNMFFSSDVFRELFILEHYDAVTWLAKEYDGKYCVGCCQENCDTCRHNEVKVDSNKYVAALNELGQIRGLANKLSE